MGAKTPNQINKEIYRLIVSLKDLAHRYADLYEDAYHTKLGGFDPTAESALSERNAWLRVYAENIGTKVDFALWDIDAAFDEFKKAYQKADPVELDVCASCFESAHRLQQTKYGLACNPCAQYIRRTGERPKGDVISKRGVDGTK